MEQQLSFYHSMKKFDTVLLIEDDPISRYTTVLVLKKAELAEDFHYVNDGLEAIEYLHEHRSRLNTDDLGSLLMILDLNMPIYDGFDVLRYLKMNRVINLDRVDIMILTSSCNELDKATAFRYNIKAFVEKPLTREKLIEAGIL